MSDARRYYLENIIGNSYALYEEKVDGLNEDAIEVVLASDYDSIVSNLQKRIEYLDSQVNKEQKDVQEYIKIFCKIKRVLEFYGDNSRYDPYFLSKDKKGIWNDLGVKARKALRTFYD